LMKKQLRFSRWMELASILIRPAETCFWSLAATSKWSPEIEWERID
jgi:hypothetical protein